MTWEADYLAVQSIANKHGFSLSPAEYFLSRRFPNRIAYEAVSAVVEQRRVDALSIYFSMKDRETKLRALATEMADEIRMSFVYKNFRKLAFIVDAKGNLKSAIAREHTISLNGLTGTFDFTFKDGARFTATNSVVYVVNAYGTRFSRFPLTFHNVRLANGGRLARPSQEKMNTIFARKG